MESINKKEGKNILFVPIGEDYRASSRLRVWNIAPLLIDLGYQCKTVTYIRNIGAGLSGIIKRKLDSKFRAEREIRNLLNWCDIIVLQEVVLSTRLLKAIKRKNIQIVFDYSDPIHLLHKDPKLSHLARAFHYFFHRNQFLNTIKAASITLVENERVADFSKQYCETLLLRGPIDCKEFVPKSIANVIPIIGWTGSPGTYSFIKPLVQKLDELAQYQRFKLVLVGCGKIETDFKHLNLDILPWDKSTEKSIVSSFDLGLFNINNTENELQRGGGKLFVYMASGVVYIAPALGIAKEVQRESNAGILFNNLDDFSQTVVDTLNDSNQLLDKAQIARNHALKYYSQEYAVKLWVNILENIN